MLSQFICIIEVIVIINVSFIFSNHTIVRHTICSYLLNLDISYNYVGFTSFGSHLIAV